MKLVSTNSPRDLPRASLRVGMIAVCGIFSPSGCRNSAVTANQSARAPTIAASENARDISPHITVVFVRSGNDVQRASRKEQAQRDELHPPQGCSRARHRPERR